MFNNTARPIHLFLCVAFLVLSPLATAFQPQHSSSNIKIRQSPGSNVDLYLSSNSNSDDDGLGKKFGGYTAKQRLREEVESPFRQVRLFFFAGSAGSAMTALYFSALNVLKASMGGFTDTPSMDDSIQSCAINAGAAVICGLLAYRDYKAGEGNLARIAKGGELARLVVTPAATTSTRVTLSDYRRSQRVLIAAGDKQYISELALSLNADQLKDENTLPLALQEVDVVVVPVLLEKEGDKIVVADTQSYWKNEVKPASEERDRNFDIERSNNIVSFPTGVGAWTNYLESDIETATKQGFDVLNKGITIVVKKNGKILRRTTGQPQWAGFVNTMEVMDGSKFGMPGDTERYGA